MMSPNNHQFRSLAPFLDVCCVGHASWDITMQVEHHPEADEKMHAEALQYSGGGPSANAAVTVARLGGKAGWCGYLGHDTFGELHLQELIREGVDTSGVVRGKTPSPVSTILAKADGCRSVVNHKAQTPWLKPDAIDFSTMDFHVLLIDGHEPELSLPLVEQARAKATPVVLDAGSLREGTAQLAHRVDYLVASSRFALDFSNTDNPQQALKRLAEISPNVVITLGNRGLLWARDGSQGQLDALPVEAVDSTGAGDAFHGAFAYGLACKMEWQDLLHYASTVGALTCTALGARTAIPDWVTVMAMIMEQGGKAVES